MPVVDGAGDGDAARLGQPEPVIGLIEAVESVQLVSLAGKVPPPEAEEKFLRRFVAAHDSNSGSCPKTP
jgi:hypothetical protein